MRQPADPVEAMRWTHDNPSRLAGACGRPPSVSSLALMKASRFSNRDGPCVRRPIPVRLISTPPDCPRQRREPTCAIPEVRPKIAHVAERDAMVMKRGCDDENEYALNRGASREEPPEPSLRIVARPARVYGGAR